ncbi:SLAM family member 8-like [Sylvia atricapilla]|uniref:SLAM family member 8-like n=1 Tax=Sylvia atricapilla TaxID=48155 RepID=UPI0033936B20
MAPGLLLNLLLFLLFITPAACSQDPHPLEVTAVTGGVTLLNPPVPLNPQNYSQIHWRWKNQVKIADRKRGAEPRYPQTRFEGRLELLDNHALKMCHLELGDSGGYQLYLEDEQGQEKVLHVLLKVYDIVPKPQVTATTNDEDDPQRCQATLNCSVSLPDVTYEWFWPQEPQGKAEPVLGVTPDTDGDIFMCKVTNAVSSSNASLTYRQPCTWTGESSSVTCATPSAVVTFILLFLLLAVA